MNTSFGGGFVPQSTQNEGAVSERRRATNLVPLAIRQILDAPHESPLTICDHIVNIVNVLGTAKLLERTETKISLVLDDGTGSIKGHQWIHGGTDEAADVHEDDLVRVIGNVNFDIPDEKILAVYRILKVQDEAEVRIHELEIEYMQLVWQKGLDRLSSIPGTSTAADGSAGLSVGWNENQKMLYTVFKNGPGSGLSIAEAAQKLAGRMQLSEVTTELNFLMGEGAVYNIQDDKFAATE